MHKHLLYFFILFSFNILIGQSYQRCHTEDYIAAKKAASVDYTNELENTFQLISEQSSFLSRSDEIYNIPVVIHILYKTENLNLPDSVVHNQIARLNADFRKWNEDTLLTREIFKSRATDTRIQFYLAGIDPEGQPTNGITRTQTNTDFGFSLISNNVKQSAQGGKDAWSTDKYLNIWVCDLKVFGFTAVLGYAAPPLNAPNWPDGSSAEAQFDGVVVHYEVFGSNNSLRPQNLQAVSRGRTTTHEVGHYLGLRHIWGDGGGFGGGDGCAVDDGIEDTPNAAAASQQACDYNVNTCIDEGIDEPDMLENYMDYSDERCMNMFTLGQKNAMRYVLEVLRPDLIDPENAPVNANNLKYTPSISIYPNPFKNQFSIKSFDLEGFYNVAILDLNGKTMWNEKINFSENADFKINTTQLNKGFYLLKFYNHNHELQYKMLKI